MLFSLCACTHSCTPIGSRCTCCLPCIRAHMRTLVCVLKNFLWCYLRTSFLCNTRVQGDVFLLISVPAISCPSLRLPGFFHLNCGGHSWCFEQLTALSCFIHRQGGRLCPSRLCASGQGLRALAAGVSDGGMFCSALSSSGPWRACFLGCDYAMIPLDEPILCFSRLVRKQSGPLECRPDAETLNEALRSWGVRGGFVPDPHSTHHWRPCHPSVPHGLKTWQ